MRRNDGRDPGFQKSALPRSELKHPSSLPHAGPSRRFEPFVSSDFCLRLAWVARTSGNESERLVGGRLVKERLGVPRRLQKVFDGTSELANHAILARGDSALTLALVDCSACRVCEELSLKFCSGCFSACYCSEECQIKDWTIHRHHCGHIKLNSFSPVFPTHHRSCLQPFCFYSLGFW